MISDKGIVCKNEKTMNLLYIDEREAAKFANLRRGKENISGRNESRRGNNSWLTDCQTANNCGSFFANY